jgi:hypothetical protein
MVKTLNTKPHAPVHLFKAFHELKIFAIRAGVVSPYELNILARDKGFASYKHVDLQTMNFLFDFICDRMKEVFSDTVNRLPDMEANDKKYKELWAEDEDEDDED